MSVQAISSQPTVVATPSAGTSPSQPASTAQAGSGTKSTPAASSDKVSISSAAHAALLHAAVAEATETSVQTAQEASRGDIQAQHLLAKEQAAKGG
ncbi:hypothetical protein GCM10007862_11380 [Dyella lipolytica]|uniref:Uncharacterized protein n=1 Tax=Dyella lipolytica TaxID=1867835 RepID=A0ABW8IX82_9GAMM|nr:hypothetical protein [Dyella lipolytica]GLQ46087.1 hypothetical protein GCM10007862_11380 [Dyella lipolytica]